METAKSDNSLFKTIKLAITEYMGSGSTGNKFSIICRYINSDERIDRKVVKMRKNSNIMIIGELTYLETEFVVEIQDVNFLPCLLQMWKQLRLMDQPRHILGHLLGNHQEECQPKKWLRGQPTLPPPEQVTPLLLLRMTMMKILKRFHPYYYYSSFFFFLSQY